MKTHLSIMTLAAIGEHDKRHFLNKKLVVLLEWFILCTVFWVGPVFKCSVPNIVNISLVFQCILRVWGNTFLLSAFITCHKPFKFFIREMSSTCLPNLHKLTELAHPCLISYLGRYWVICKLSKNWRCTRNILKLGPCFLLYFSTSQVTQITYADIRVEPAGGKISQHCICSARRFLLSIFRTALITQDVAVQYAAACNNARWPVTLL